MPRGTTLASIRTMLKAEVHDFSGTNTARDAELNQLLANKQLLLLLEKNWSFMVRRWNAVVPAGQRFITFPTVDADFGETCTINLDEIDQVEVSWNNQWYPIMYGIGADEYNLLDPLQNQGADPVRKWREATNTGENVSPNQFEVWPLPQSAQTVRFTGEKLPRAFAADNDKADLDDMLLVLAVAADILFADKQPDAQLKAQQFARRLHQLGAQNPTRDKKRILGGGVGGEQRRDIKLVAIH